MRDSFEPNRSAWHTAGPPSARHGHFVTIRRRRAWYFRRLAFIAVMLLLLIITSMFAAGWLFAGGGSRAGAAAALVMMLLLFGVVAVMVLVSGSMRRFGSPLHTVMDAADRVAEGDYGVRVPEY